MNDSTDADGIVLLAKRPGATSFSSLFSVKKALSTKKVGHTGTLDSFAQGLLVVCTGRLTRLAGNITEFNKTYRAVIKFGEETDTLDYTGRVIKAAPLPSSKDLHSSLKKFSGALMQRPPAFSAVHINGRRASDLARSGSEVQLSERSITVFSSRILDERLNDKGLVEYALVEFSVSKGTYIRSLARDIGCDCGSAAHLTGLFRTSVGGFEVASAAGFSALKPFSIQSAILEAGQLSASELDVKNARQDGDEPLMAEILEKKLPFTEDCSRLCGFVNIHLCSDTALSCFLNGRPLKNNLFVESLYELPPGSSPAVFYNGSFYGLLNKSQEGRISYRFVLN